MQCLAMKEKYVELADGLSPGSGKLCVKVPPMRGVDEDMREWSFFMLLEHNVIVNRSITAIVEQLTKGEELDGAAKMDPKKDVMPSPDADETQVANFVDSIDSHLETVKKLKNLRGTKTAPHPIFGDFDAHKWNCMFGFHLGLHYPQAVSVVENLQDTNYQARCCKA